MQWPCYLSYLLLYSLLVLSTSGQSYEVIEESPVPLLRDGKFGFIDRSGNWVIPPQYGYAMPFVEGRALISESFPDQRKFWFINKHGTHIHSEHFTGAASFSEGLAAVSKNGKCGYIDRNGSIVIPIKFSKFENFSEGLAAVCIVDSTYVSTYWEALIDLDIEFDIETYSEERHKYDQAHKWGYIDKQGEWIIEPTYIGSLNPCGEFSEGLAIVEIDKKKGFIDRSGRFVIPPIYDDAKSFSEGRAAVATVTDTLDTHYGFVDQEWSIIDRSGRRVLERTYKNLWPYHEGLAAALDDSAYGYIDHNGDWVIRPAYSQAGPFLNGVAAVSGRSGYGFDLWGLINTVGDTILPLQYHQIDRLPNGWSLIQTDTEYGFIDKTGRVIVEPTFNGAQAFNEGLAEVTLVQGGSVWTGYINKKGDFCVQPMELNYSKSFSEGYAAIGVEDRWGYIDWFGTVEIPFDFQWAESFHDGFAVVTRLDSDGRRRYGFIDSLGKVRIPFNFNGAGDFSEGLAPAAIPVPFEEGIRAPTRAITLTGKEVTPEDSRWGYLNTVGEWEIRPQFNEARTFSEGLAVVRTGDKYGYIDHAGAFRITPRYRTASDFRGGCAVVKEDSRGNGVLIDQEGNIIFSHSEYSVEANLFGNELEGDDNYLIKGPDGWGFIDSKGTIIVEPKYVYAYPFSEGLAAVAIRVPGSGASGWGSPMIYTRRWGFIDITGELVISLEFDWIEEGFSEGLAPAEFPKRTGYVDLNGAWIVPLGR